MHKTSDERKVYSIEYVYWKNWCEHCCRSDISGSLFTLNDNGTIRTTHDTVFIKVLILDKTTRIMERTSYTVFNDDWTDKKVIDTPEARTQLIEIVERHEGIMLERRRKQQENNRLHQEDQDRKRNELSKILELKKTFGDNWFDRVTELLKSQTQTDQNVNGENEETGNSSV